MELQPNVAVLVHFRRCRSQLGDLAAGQKAFETVLRLDAQNIEALVNLGKLKILRKQSMVPKNFAMCYGWGPNIGKPQVLKIWRTLTKENH